MPYRQAPNNPRNVGTRCIMGFGGDCKGGVAGKGGSQRKNGEKSEEASSNCHETLLEAPDHVFFGSKTEWFSFPGIFQFRLVRAEDEKMTILLFCILMAGFVLGIVFVNALAISFRRLEAYEKAEKAKPVMQRKWNSRAYPAGIYGVVAVMVYLIMGCSVLVALWMTVYRDSYVLFAVYPGFGFGFVAALVFRSKPVKRGLAWVFAKLAALRSRQQYCIV